MNAQDEKLLYAMGRHIANIRLEQDMSQEDLAIKANLSREQISRIENGRRNPTYLTLVAIANALNVSVVELLDFKVQRK